MGLLSEGEPMEWEEMVAWQAHVRKYGVEQFIRLYNRLKDEKGRTLKWGDEVEYIIVKLDHKAKAARVSLRADELLKQLVQPEERMKEEEKLNGGSSVELRSLWRPEYASYMVEGTPGGPYGGSTNYFNTVEHNMRLRRRELEDLLEEDEVCVSISAFPRLGCPGFTVPETKPDPENSFTRLLPPSLH